MKKLIFGLMLLIGLFIVTPVYAQEADAGQELADLVNQFGVLLVTVVVAFMGMVSTRVTTWVRTWPVFSEEELSKISGIFADILSGVSSLLTTLVIMGVAYLGEFLTDPATSTAVLAWIGTWLAAFGWHKVSKFVTK